MGAFPELDCPRLLNFELYGKKLTGPVPPITHSTLQSFTISTASFTGDIPTFTCPSLKRLYVVARFKGKIQPQNLPALEEFHADGSHYEDYNPMNLLSGDFPSFVAPNLKTLSIASSAITGALPNINNWPLLARFTVSSNQFKGSLPSTISHTNVKDFLIGGNIFGGSVPMLTMPSAEQIDLGGCGFTGVLPAYALPNVKALSVATDKFAGAFPTLTCPVLQSVTASNIGFDAIPHLKTVCPALVYAHFAMNKLTFEDIEPNLDLGNKLYYRDQDSVTRYREVRGTNVIYTVKVGGTANQYQWYWYGALAGETAEWIDDDRYRGGCDRSSRNVHLEGCSAPRCSAIWLTLQLFSVVRR